MVEFDPNIQEPEVLTPEQKKAIARRRVFYVLIALTVVVVILCGWALVERIVK